MNRALTLITFVPVAGMVVCLVMPESMKSACKWIAAAATGVQLAIAVALYAHFDTATTAIQFAEKYQWIPTYHITYFMGVDGISISMVLLTALICFISVFASFSITRAEKAYYALLLMLDAGMMGVFVSLDFFLFYIFWEVMLLPMYFLIGIWGGPRREYAAIKFFLYTLLGSVFILIALLGFYFTDVRDFDVRAARNQPRNSFDLIVLQKAGMAAAELLNGERAESVALDALVAKKLAQHPAKQPAQQVFLAQE